MTEEFNDDLDEEFQGEQRRAPITLYTPAQLFVQQVQSEMDAFQRALPPDQTILLVADAPGGLGRIGIHRLSAEGHIVVMEGVIAGRDGNPDVEAARVVVSANRAAVSLVVASVDTGSPTIQLVR